MSGLKEMDLEELWRLFPIVLREHDPAWAEWFTDEQLRLAQLWGADAARISHVGSTAVPGLVAKPTVDILLELDESVVPQEVVDRTRNAGWLLMSGEAVRPLRLSFNKGYTPAGFAERVFHLHVRPSGDWDQLYFRDYLRENADVAAQYAELKRSLAAEHERDRDAYTAAKGDFVREATARARAAFGGRYAPKS